MKDLSPKDAIKLLTTLVGLEVFFVDEKHKKGSIEDIILNKFTQKDHSIDIVSANENVYLTYYWHDLGAVFYSPLHITDGYTAIEVMKRVQKVIVSYHARGVYHEIYTKDIR